MKAPIDPAEAEVAAATAETLEGLEASLSGCERCVLATGRTKLVFGVGSGNARLMFVGEGPGRDEDLQGIPFVGKAGELLTKMILAMGLTREEVYIANVVKCRPPRNRNPEPDEVLQCSPFLRRQIALVQPEVIVSMGKFATETLFGEKLSILRTRGNWGAYEGVPLMPTLHPAYLLRNPSAKRDAWSDLQKVMARMGLESPKRG